MSLSRAEEYEWIKAQSWYSETLSREDANAFIAKLPKRRFVMRPSKSVPGCFSMTHKVPNGEVGNCLLQRRTKGWQISGSDKYFDTLADLLAERSVLYPKSGEEGCPGKLQE